MKFGTKLKDKLYSISDKVEGIGAKQREKREAKKEIKMIRFNAQYEEDKKYLAEKKEYDRKNKVVSLARAERRKEGLPYKFVSGVQNLQKGSPKRKLAKTNKNALFSSGNIRTGSFDNSVLFGNMRKK